MSFITPSRIGTNQAPDQTTGTGFSEMMGKTIYYEACDDTSFQTANVFTGNDPHSSIYTQAISPQIICSEDNSSSNMNKINHASSYHMKSSHYLHSPIKSRHKKQLSESGHDDEDDQPVEGNESKSIRTYSTLNENQTNFKGKQLNSDHSSLLISLSRIDKVKIPIEPMSLDINFLKSKLRCIPSKAKNVSKKNKHLSTLIELQNFYCDENHHTPIWVFKFSCDGKYLAAGGKNGTLKIFEVMTDDSEKYEDSYNEGNCIQNLYFINEQPLRTYHDHSSDIIDLSWSSFNKDQLITGSLDSYAILWSIASPYPIMKFCHGEMVTTIAFSPINPNEFVSGCLDRFIRIWPIQKDPKPEYFNIKEKIISVTYSPSGDSLAIGTHNGKVLIYDLIPAIRYNCSFNCKNHMGTNSRGKKVTNIEFVNKSAALITTSDSRLRYVTMPDGKLIHKYKGFTNESSMIRAHNDDTHDMIISGSEDKYCYLWHRLNLENKNKKNYSYEYFKPSANDVIECSNFACEQAMSAYLKKVYKFTTKFVIQSIIVNSTDSGKLQVLLNLTETSSQ